MSTWKAAEIAIIGLRAFLHELAKRISFNMMKSHSKRICYLLRENINKSLIPIYNRNRRKLGEIPITLYRVYEPLNIYLWKEVVTRLDRA